VSLNASWLTASTLTGMTPFSTDIGINPNGLAAGTYTGKVIVATVLGASTRPLRPLMSR
jgi:hypothetical protein